MRFWHSFLIPVCRALVQLGLPKSTYYRWLKRQSEGRLQMLTIIDEYTWECLAILVERHISSQDVIDQLFHLFILRGIPRSTSGRITGPEFTARAVESLVRQAWR